jgi:hypothetical protein
MMISRRFKAGCLMTLLIAFCLGIGFVVGILAQQAWKKKTEDPAFMKWAAMKHLDKLEPSAEQRLKMEAQVDQAVAELMRLKSTALKNIWDIIDRTGLAIDQELDGQQKERWQQLKPQRPEEAR